MHKNYQPYNPCGNKFLQKRWDNVNYTDHKTRVRIAKPMVDTKAPKERLHVKNKLKKQQLERERRAVIDRDNYTLLSSMQRTMEGGRCTVDHKYTYEHHSLNYEQRRRELSKINNDNHGILSRLHVCVHGRRTVMHMCVHGRRTVMHVCVHGRRTVIRIRVCVHGRRTVIHVCVHGRQTVIRIRVCVHGRRTVMHVCAWETNCHACVCAWETNCMHECVCAWETNCHACVCMGDELSCMSVCVHGRRTVMHVCAWETNCHACVCVCMGDELSCMCVCMGDELSCMCVRMGDELSRVFTWKTNCHACACSRETQGLATGPHHACMHVWLVLCQVHAFLFTCTRMHTCKIACVCRPY